MFTTAAFLKLFESLKSLAFRNFKLFVIFMELAGLIYLYDDTRKVRVENAEMVNRFLDFKDKMIQKAEEYNQRDRDQEAEIRKINEERIKDLKEIKYNRNEIRNLK